MNADQSEYRYYEEFCQCCKTLHKFKAVQYIDELWHQHGKAIHPTNLYNLYNNPDISRQDHCHSGLYLPEANLDYYSPPELPIPICDEKTLYQVRRAVAQTSRLLQEAREDCDPPRIEQYEQEMEKLYAYLAQCLNKHGHIRYITNLTHEHTKLIKRSVRRLYKILSKSNPDLKHYLESHVRIGCRCVWN